MSASEMNLWQSFKEGSREAVHTLYFKYYNSLFAYGLHITDDRELVSDAIHDLFIKLWSNRNNLGNISAEKAYLLTSLRHVLFNLLTKQKKYFLSPDIESLPFEMTFSVEADYIKREVAASSKKELVDSLNKLTRRQKEVIYLRFFEELDFDRIAEIMHVNVKTVYKLLARNLDAMRQILTDDFSSQHSPP